MTARGGGLTNAVLPLVGLRRASRLALLGFLAAGAVAAWHWRTVFDPATISAAIARYPIAPLGFLAVHIAASLLFVPRTILAIVAGLLFGAGWGIVWAAAGSVAGAVAGFLAARHLYSGLDDLGRFGPVAAQVERGGWRAVAMVRMLRLIPVMPHSVANYGLGLTKLTLSSYALGSFLGQLPMTIAYVDLGAAGERLLVGGANWVEPTLIGIAALSLSLLIPAIGHRRAR
ncbi:MAG: TVP38/TMEM64 family protein [Alphaproteobacteria bacterium]|nr:MAG: TVP38/TMEM64 family protein [Alphaproteobacteria bacterium]